MCHCGFVNPKELIQFSRGGPSAMLLHLLEIDLYLFSIFFLLQYLAVGIVPGKLPTPCVHLNYLSIRINFNDVEEVLTALCLLRSSPNLQELEVLVSFFLLIITLASSKLTSQACTCCQILDFHVMLILSVSSAKL